MKTIIVGGSPGKKVSGVVNKLKEALSDEYALETSVSGGNYEIELLNGELPENIKGFDLVMWMPDIANEEEKNYPIKDKGSILICSKVMREGYTEMDAVTRIFKMHGNAVIAIYKPKEGPFKFKLIDALGHIWSDTSDILKLAKAICKLCSWTKNSIRKSIPRMAIDKLPDEIGTYPEIETFMELNKTLAYKSATHCGNRYFGNFSTRCTRLFPSCRNKDVIAMSPRNVDKRSITPKDLVQIIDWQYIGDRKPSVDAPIQLTVYNVMPNINFMIHGHAYIKDAPTTKKYFPCGDLRESVEIKALLKKGHIAINLLHHGFLIATKSLDEMMAFEKQAEFKKIYNF